MPFKQKIVQVAQEPVAFQLYKKRHFKSKIAEPNVQRSETPQGNLRRNLLNVANAKIIKDIGLREIVEDATDKHKLLDYRILGLPKAKELQIYHQISLKIDEMKFYNTNNKINKNLGTPSEQEESQWLKMPPPHLMSANHRLLTNLTVE